MFVVATRLSKPAIRNYVKRCRSRQRPILCTTEFSSNTGSTTSNERQRGRNTKKGDRLKRDRGSPQHGTNKDRSKPLIRKLNDKNNKNNMTKDTKVETRSSTLSKCNDIMAKLLHRRQDLPPPPIDWLSSDHELLDESDNLKREDLYKDVISLTQAIDLSIRGNRIQASSGRDIRDLTALLGNILLICSESPPKRITMNDLPNTSQTCSKVLSLFNALNLDIHNIHNFCTIRAANQEHEWELSSSLFRKQIDPDFNGLVPVDPQLGWNAFLEMGLYGLSMDLSHRGFEGFRVVEEVLNAVRDMCMVSPTDQEKYVMAAGSALGRAGQWQGCVDYILNHSDSSELGQPLFAAVMNACYICEEYESVIEIYYNMQQGAESTGSEWQWEGEYARSHPLCMDLLLRSVGMRMLRTAADRNQGFGEATLLIFNQIIEEGGRISLDAIRGVLRACENDADNERAIRVLKILQGYKQSESDWKIVHGSAKNFLYNSEESSIVAQAIDDDVLATVIDACCAAEEYGHAIMCLRTSDSIAHYPTSNAEVLNSNGSFMVDKLLAQQPMLRHSKRLLESTVMALTGLQSTQDAITLYSKCTNNPGSLGKHLPSVNRNQINAPWRESFRHMDRLLYAADAIRNSNQKLTQEDQYNVSLGTALMLKCATKAGQVNAGLEVANIVISSISAHKNSQKSMKDAMKSFFGIEKEIHETDESFWFLSDELFASAIAARRVKYGVENAYDFYFSGMSAIIAKNGSRMWFESTDLVLALIVEQGDIDRASDFFDSLENQTRTSETYAIMANGYKVEERWDKIAALYLAAKKEALLSERLCFLAMEAIAESVTSSKIKTLRSVTNDIATLKGVKSGEWIADNYWKLKQICGFHHARLLMWWNDPSETKKMEFRLAAQHLKERKRKGLASEKDVLTVLIQLANGKALDNVEPAFIKEFHPPTLVLLSLIELCGFECDDEVSQSLLEGILYLSKSKNVDLCKEFLDHVESNGCIVEEEILFLARTAADLQPSSDQTYS